MPQQNFFTNSIAESFGFYPRSGGGYSFLGMSEDIRTSRAATPAQRTNFSSLKHSQSMRGAGRSVPASTLGTAQQAFKASGAHSAAKFAGRTAMKALPLLGTIAMMYSGYQSDGVLGAIGGAAEGVAVDLAFKGAGALLKSGALPIAAGAALIGASTYMAMKVGKEHMKGLRNIEFGANNLSAVGSHNAATMRQRAAMALRHTYINGRTAMGNEALLFHTNY